MTCPACGFPESRLKYSLQLGCPACYESFAPHLCTFLPKLHTGTTHKGKKPAPSTADDLLQRIDALASRIAHQDCQISDSQLVATLQTKSPRPRA